MSKSRPAGVRLDGGKEAPAVYALLSVDSRKLVLAQRDIRTLEPVADIIGKAVDRPGACGQLRFENRPWPVYALAEDLSVTEQIPSSRRVCALINRPGSYFAILCDRLDLVEETGLKFQPTPICMITPTCAIDTLAVYDNGIALFCSVTGLIRVLGIEDNRNTSNGY
jgi:hypothetical protein